MVGCVFGHQSRDVESKLRRVDEEKGRLASDLRDALTARATLEQDLRAAQKRSEDDARAWAQERSRLTTMLESAAGVGRRSVGGGDTAEAEAEKARLRAEVDRLSTEREAILRNWKAETDRMLAAWQQERQAWQAEKEAVNGQVGVGVGVPAVGLALVLFVFTAAPGTLSSHP